MKLLYRIVGFQVVVLGYILLFLPELRSSPFVYGRLSVIFLAGAVMAFFAQGQQYGTLQPVSTRPIMVVVGVLLMGAGLVWGLTIRGHV
jgi:uncharacterized membrane protein YbaN (DUF454 family)